MIKPALKALFVFGLAAAFSVPFLPAQGQWEFGAHYSTWGINVIKPLIEDNLNETIESDLKDKILEEIRKGHPTLREKSYSQNIRFDSSGNNYGFEVRFYPGGKKGSFSLGLSVEKTTMKVSFPDISSSLVVEDAVAHQTADFTGGASAEFLLKPFSFHLSFRWDIFPSSRVHPYLTVGFGASTAAAIKNAVYSYNYSGALNLPGHAPEIYSGSESKSLKQLIDEQEAKGEDFAIPVNFVPFFQLNLGLKGELTENVYLLVDAGIWDGFLLRGGVAYRF